MDDQRTSLRAFEIVSGEGVGGRDDLPRPIGTDEQRCEVAARRMVGAATNLKMTACGVEVAGCAAGRGDRVCFALADRVNVHPVAARGQDPAAAVSTVTVAYPPVKSIVAVATDLPSGVFSSALTV